MFRNGARVSATRALFLLLLALSLSAASGKRKFTGVITDSECATGDHSTMKMGTTDAECTRACVDTHGATFMLYDGKTAWNLSDQKAPEKLAGRKVTVTGTADEKTRTIRVESIK